MIALLSVKAFSGTKKPETKNGLNKNKDLLFLIQSLEVGRLLDG